jgi:hypothetical protein
MPLRRTAWIEAARIFGVSRLATAFITIMALRAPLTGQTATRNCTLDAAGSCFLSTWYHWDVFPYTRIAEHGYSNLYDTVFSPSGLCSFVAWQPYSSI